MRRIALTLVLACTAPLLPADPLVKDTKPIALFNGRDLAGLEIFTEGAAGTGWKAEDGLLAASARPRVTSAPRAPTRTTT